MKTEPMDLILKLENKDGKVIAAWKVHVDEKMKLRYVPCSSAIKEEIKNFLEAGGLTK